MERGGVLGSFKSWVLNYSPEPENPLNQFSSFLRRAEYKIKHAERERERERETKFLSRGGETRGNKNPGTNADDRKKKSEREAGRGGSGSWPAELAAQGTARHATSTL